MITDPECPLPSRAPRLSPRVVDQASRVVRILAAHEGDSHARVFAARQEFAYVSGQWLPSELEVIADRIRRGLRSIDTLRTRPINRTTSRIAADMLEFYATAVAYYYRVDELVAL